MKTVWKRWISLCLAAVFALSSLPLNVFAEAAQQEESATESCEVVYSITVELDDSVPALNGVMLYGLDALRLADGNYTEWIDRITVPEYARAFYDTLVEGCDNDGTADLLIEDVSYAAGGILLGTFDAGSDYQTWMNENFSIIAQHVRAVYDAFERDHPEVFWLSGANTLTLTVGGYGGSYEAKVYFVLQDAGSSFDVRMEEYRSEDAIRSTIAQLHDTVNSVLADAGSSDYEKVRSFNEFLTTTNEYNTVVSGVEAGTPADTSWVCVSALFGSSGVNGPVCEGYARAFKVLCDRAEIPCVLVDNVGAVSASENHMWNYVQLDGAWYGVDVTWNDPVVLGVSGVVSGMEREDYLLVGAETLIDGTAFLFSHPVGNTPSGVISFTNGPVLSSSAYTYMGHLHEYEAVVTAPTCTEAGYTTYTCSCGNNYNGDETAALGHAYAAGKCVRCKEADAGFANPDCSTTAEEYYQRIIAMKEVYPDGTPWNNNNYYRWNGGIYNGGYGCAGFAFLLSDAAFGTLPAEQITDGITVEDITIDMLRVGDVLSVNGNTHSVVVLEVHEDYIIIAEGNYNSSVHWGRKLTADYIAEKSDYLMTRYPEHSWSEWVTVGGLPCTEATEQRRECTVCGQSESRMAEPTGHDYAAVVTEPTCTEQGYTTHTCTVCGDSYVDSYVDAWGHSFTSYTSNNDAACTQDGTKTAKCDRCDVTDTVRDIGSATEHSVMIDSEVAPTCTETGLTEGKHCSVCGEVLMKQEEVPATGHTYSGDCDAVCNAADCGYIRSVDAQHTYDAAVDTICNVCGYEREVAAYLPGDINGDGNVNNKDATRLFQYLSYWNVEVVEAALDVNGDGSVNNKDATRLFQYLSQWNVEIF